MHSDCGLGAGPLTTRRGDSVARLQEALQELGYDVGPIDGIFGYLTLTR